MQFSAHGEYDFNVGENYLVVSTSGGFNTEGVQSLFVTIIEIATKHNLQDWSYVEIIDKDSFITPDAVEVLFAKYAELKQAGCRQVLTVCGNWMQKEVFHKLKAKVPLPVLCCESESEALAIVEANP